MNFRNKSVRISSIKKVKKIHYDIFVSVLMNCHRENEQTFKRAVDSVYASKGVKIQLIVSTVKGDNCIKWCEDYPITLVVNEKAGIFTQFNAMIPYIKGDFSTYASANDVMFSNKLYDECKFLIENPDKKIVYSNIEVVEITGSKWVFKAPVYDYANHLKGSFVTDCAMIRSELYRKYFPLHLEWGNNAVWDFYLRIYKAEGNVFAPLNVTTWRYKKNVNSSSYKRRLDKEKYLANEKLKKDLCKFHKKTFQLRTSGAIRFFHNKIKEKYNLIEYSNNDLRTIFFGLYNINDYKALARHKGSAVILWGGSDAMKIKTEYIPLIKKCINIAQSSFIENDLNKLNIDCEFIPITTCSTDIKPTPIGDSIYFYEGSGTDFYGCHLIDKIKEKTGLNVIIANAKTYTQEELSNIYDKCFISLRLTEHDGLPHTVVEMAMKGRPSIFNDDKVPNCYKWKNENDICKTILKVYKNRNKIDTKKIRQDMINYLNTGDKWLNI